VDHTELSTLSPKSGFITPLPQVNSRMESLTCILCIVMVRCLLQSLEYDVAVDDRLGSGRARSTSAPCLILRIACAERDGAQPHAFLHDWKILCGILLAFSFSDGLKCFVSSPSIDSCPAIENTDRKGIDEGLGMCLDTGLRGRLSARIEVTALPRVDH
jgi:hypothetical protein